jgi:hypothetical protein
MVNPTPIPGRDANKPSPLDGLSKLELIDKPSVLDQMSKLELKACALGWLDRAALKHQEARLWRNRCLKAEAELEALKARKDRQ